MWTIQQIAENEWQVLRDGQPVEIMPGRTSVERYDLAVAFIATQLQSTLDVADGTPTGDGLLPESWEDDEGIFFSEPTGDGRDFSQCQWTWRDPAAVPVPLMLQTSTDIGHFGAQLAGFVEQISSDESGTGHASGRFYDTEIGRQFRDMLLGDRRFGVSVDPGSVDATYACVEEDEDGWCLEERIDFLAYQVIGVTGTPFAGFERAKIKLSGAVTAAVAVTAGATSFEDLPLSDRETSWDAAAAEGRVRTFYSSDDSGDADTMDWASYRKAFFWYDEENEEAFGSYKLGFADIIDGKLTAVWSGVTAAAGAMQGARGGVDIPEGDVSAVQSHIASYYDKAAKEYDDEEIKPPWEDQAAESDAAFMEMITGHDFEDDGNGYCAVCVNEDDNGECMQRCGAVEDMHGTAEGDGEGDGEDAMAAAATIELSIPLVPPAHWLSLPEPVAGDTGGHDLYGAAAAEILIEQPDGGLAVPLQILDSGLVYGHLARWGQRHVGFPGDRVTPPESAAAYAHFHVGHVVCDDGSDVACGTLVVGCEHAQLRGLTPGQARDYYAHAGFGFANVRVSNGQYGVWACGVLRPDVTAAQVRVLRSLALSGDWRRIGGSLELIGALAVSVPGFPVAREHITASGLETVEAARVAGAVEAGETSALVAAGMVYRCSECAKRAAARARVGEAEVDDVIGQRLTGIERTLAIVERRTRHLRSAARDDIARTIRLSTSTESTNGNGHVTVSTS